MSEKQTSYLLLIVQILSLVFIFLTGPLIPSDSVTLLVLLLGLGIGIWAAFTFRTTKFSLLAEIPENAALIIDGPYRVIRHPMYTSVMLIAAALVVNEPSPSRLIALIVLAATLFIKMEREEVYLNRHFKEYGEYKAKTQKLIPFLY